MEVFSIKQKIIIILFISAILIYLTWPKTKTNIMNDIQQNKPFDVNITGEVVYPGTYTLYYEIGLEKLIEYAGGFTKYANKNINLNQIINKKTTIKIERDPNIIDKININTATYNDLINIPYITERIALEIIQTRNEKGYFKSIDDLLEVKYIGEATLEKIRPYIEV